MKNNKFNKYLNSIVGDQQQDIKFKIQILNTHAIMARYKSFTMLALQDQFEYCVTICRIAVHTSMHDLQNARFSNEKKQNFELSIYRV